MKKSLALEVAASRVMKMGIGSKERKLKQLRAFFHSLRRCGVEEILKRSRLGKKKIMRRLKVH